MLGEFAPDPGGLDGGDMDPNEAGLWIDWEFHQAIGMVAAQLDVFDMDAAAHQLACVADQLGESIHDTSLLVLDRRVRLVWRGGRVIGIEFV